MRVDLVFETVFSGFTRSMPLDRLGMWQFSTRRHLIALHGCSVRSRFSHTSIWRPEPERKRGAIAEGVRMQPPANFVAVFLDGLDVPFLVVGQRHGRNSSPLPPIAPWDIFVPIEFRI